MYSSVTLEIFSSILTYLTYVCMYYKIPLLFILCRFLRFLRMSEKRYEPEQKKMAEAFKFEERSVLWLVCIEFQQLYYVSIPVVFLPQLYNLFRVGNFGEVLNNFTLECRRTLHGGAYLTERTIILFMAVLSQSAIESHKPCKNRFSFAVGLNL